MEKESPKPKKSLLDQVNENQIKNNIMWSNWKTTANLRLPKYIANLKLNVSPTIMRILGKTDAELYFLFLYENYKKKLLNSHMEYYGNGLSQYSKAFLQFGSLGTICCFGIYSFIIHKAQGNVKQVFLTNKRKIGLSFLGLYIFYGVAGMAKIYYRRREHIWGYGLYYRDMYGNGSPIYNEFINKILQLKGEDKLKLLEYESQGEKIDIDNINKKS